MSVSSAISLNIKDRQNWHCTFTLGQSCFYVDTLAILEITFAPDVVPLITRLEEHFTSYQLKQVSQLTSKYAIRLYELLIAWREVGKTPQIDLAEFRQKIGVEAKNTSVCTTSRLGF